MSPVDARSPSTSTGGSILREGQTCWRVAHADRVAVIADAAAYFAAAKAAILQARHTVFLVGWDFDLRIGLERRNAMPGVPDELGEFLTHVVENQPELRIFVLRWDLSFLKFPFRATLPLKLLDWLSGKRVDLRLDHEHPTGACHHQKIVVVDDSVAFCGGIDMTDFRWDTPAHADGDPCRVDPNGESYSPWHDTTTCVMGEAARVLGDLARERWRRATGEEVPPAPPCDPRWPDHLPPDFTDLQVAIARTEPAYGEAQPEVREIEALYLAAIRAARRSIYVETQYFASHRIAAALGERLQEEHGPEVIVINPKTGAGWLEEEVMGPARAVLLRHLGKCDRHRRFRIYTPVTEKGDDIYVHSKVVVVDDRLLRVGSSNLNNRSMGLDTECDLAIEAPSASDSAMRQAITHVRDRLLAEHLRISQDQFAETLDGEAGSLIRAIERLRREHGRSLVPFQPPPFSDMELALAESRALDPDHPEEISEVMRRGLAGAGLRKALGTGLVATTGVAAAVVFGQNRVDGS